MKPNALGEPGSLEARVSAIGLAVEKLLAFGARFGTHQEISKQLIVELTCEWRISATSQVEGVVMR